MNKKKIIFIIGGILLIALIIFLVFKFKGDKNEGQSYSSNGDNNRTSSVSNNNQNNELNSQSENKEKNSNKSSNQSSSNNSENVEEQYSGGKTADGTGWRIDSCRIKGQDEIIVPDSIAGYPVKEIGDNAFTLLDCKKIKLPDTVTYIGPAAFSMCKNLEEVDLGKGLKYITTHAFINCRKLKSVTFPDGMETIDDILINTCPEVGEIYIPASVTTMPDVYLFSKNLCPNAVIVTPAGSAAEKYAIEYNLPYKNK